MKKQNNSKREDSSVEFKSADLGDPRQVANIRIEGQSMTKEIQPKLQQGKSNPAIILVDKTPFVVLQDEGRI